MVWLQQKWAAVRGKERFECLLQHYTHTPIWSGQGTWDPAPVSLFLQDESYQGLETSGLHSTHQPSPL